jgi:hypothetical protein
LSSNSPFELSCSAAPEGHLITGRFCRRLRFGTTTADYAASGRRVNHGLQLGRSQPASETREVRASAEAGAPAKLPSSDAFRILLNRSSRDPGLAPLNGGAGITKRCHRCGAAGPAACPDSRYFNSGTRRVSSSQSSPMALRMSCLKSLKTGGGNTVWRILATFSRSVMPTRGNSHATASG